MNEEEEYLEPTISALVSCFGADEGKIRSYNADNPDSQYYVIKKAVYLRMRSPPFRSWRRMRRRGNIFRASGLRRNTAEAIPSERSPAM